MAGHHLILGKCIDVITGETLDDTFDERYRQKIARLLLETKDYPKNSISVRVPLKVQAGKNNALIKIDFLITLNKNIRMMIKFGPGSLVTRQRPALAVSRVIAPYQVPVVVVTNGEDADIMDGHSGNIFAHGIESIPSKNELLEITEARPVKPVSGKQAEMESRIIYAYEVDGTCPCDDSVCKL